MLSFHVNVSAKSPELISGSSKENWESIARLETFSCCSADCVEWLSSAEHHTQSVKIIGIT